MITIDKLIEKLHWIKQAKITADIESINTFSDYIEFKFSDGISCEIIGDCILVDRENSKYLENN